MDKRSIAKTDKFCLDTHVHNGHDGPMNESIKLKDWLANNKISVPEFASMIGVKTARTVYRYINYERIPDRETMPKIIKATRGEVTANSFYQ